MSDSNHENMRRLMIEFAEEDARAGAAPDYPFNSVYMERYNELVGGSVRDALLVLADVEEGRMVEEAASMRALATVRRALLEEAPDANP